MFISLKVENEEMLASGGSAVYRSTGHDFEIGRHGSDWTLPDPERIVSSRHCRIAYRDGAYWLHDLSRNGTFINGSRERLTAPHRLRDGDRLRIGRYIVRVALDDAVPADRLGARPSYPANPEFRKPAPGQAPADDDAGRPSFSSFEGDPFLARPDISPAGAQARLEGDACKPSHSIAAAIPDSQRADNLLRHIADAAGISPDILLRRDPEEVASEIGAVLRLVVEELAALLKARAAAKSMVKSTHRTMIGGADNNPLKFVPSPDEMLEIMFSRRRPGYMDAARSVGDAFRDLKSHEMATYAAMQTALARLLENISPHTIEKKLAPSTFMSKKARAWDALLAAWAAREEVHENGMLDVFLAYFSEAYADASKGH